MPSPVFAEAMDFVVLLLFFVAAPAIAIAIAIRARKGWPKNFSRETYWTAFVFGMIAAILLLVAFLRTDLKDPLHALLHFICGAGGAIIFGVAGGFLLGTFTSRGPIFTPSPPKK